MSVPTRTNDGNFSSALEVASDFRFPFADKGDMASFEVVLTYRIDKVSYSPATPMSTLFVPQLSTFPSFGVCYLVDQGDAKDQGNGECEYDRVYASLPQTRLEGATLSYTQQWWRAMTHDANEDDKYFYSVNYDIAEQQFTVAGEYQYEYFTSKPSPLIKPRVYLLYELLYYLGGTTSSGPSGSGSRVIAEDSEVGIHKGGIYYRKTPYVTLK